MIRPILLGSVLLPAAVAAGVVLVLARSAPAQDASAASRYGRLFLVQFLDRQKGFGLAEANATQNVVLRTVNGGKTWTPAWRFGGSTTFNDMFFLSTKRGYITTDSRLMETVDGGESWGRIKMAFTYDLRKIRFLTPMRGWVLALPPLRANAGPTVLYTTNGGQAWMPDRLQPGSVIDFCMASQTHGWLADDDGVQATVDGGRTWSRKHGIEGLRGVSCHGEERAWALRGREVVRTTDRGAAWTTHAVGGSGRNDFNLIQFASRAAGWVYNEQELRGSDDGGTTWGDRAQAPGPPTFLDPTTGYALDGNGGLFWTSDAGRTWAQ